ncbi:hypothetical protein M569_17277, partial [Genlisea aurea]
MDHLSRACETFQAERLSEFYEICKSIDVGRGERFIKIEQPPASFLQAMEEYVREAPRGPKPKTVLAIENKKPSEETASQQPPEPEKELEPEPPAEPEPEVQAEVIEPPPDDLLGLREPSPAASELDEKNAMALAIVPVEQRTQNQPVLSAGATTGWELALVSAPSSNETAASAAKLGGGLDRLTLDSLYDDAIRRSNNQNTSYNPWEQPSMMMGNNNNAFAAPPHQANHNPFYYASTNAAP